jgi:hypothetical protein
VTVDTGESYEGRAIMSRARLNQPRPAPDDHAYVVTAIPSDAAFRTPPSAIGVRVIARVSRSIATPRAPQRQLDSK